MLHDICRKSEDIARRKDTIRCTVYIEAKTPVVVPEWREMIRGCVGSVA